MTLTRLLIELLEHIITRTLLKDFESVALICKKIHAICTSFFQSHSTLRSRFHNFNYIEDTTNSIHIIKIAFDVITRIVVKFIVARYIRHANFEMNNKFT